jgi:hypothetical protein
MLKTILQKEINMLTLKPKLAFVSYYLMHISREIFLIPLILIMVLFAGCSNKKVESQWDDQSISIDGNGKDWESLPLEYDEELDIVYGIVNDENSLNLLLRFRDHKLALKMNSRGAILWLDEKGKKKKHFGIWYIDEDAITDITQMMASRKNQASGQRSSFQQQPQPLKGSFSLLGEDTLSIPSAGLNGLAAATGYHDGTYCYEFRIPLRKSEETPYALEAALGKKIKVGMEIAAVSEEVRKQIEEQMAERQQSGSGRGGGMRGGGRGGGGKGGGMRGGGRGGTKGGGGASGSSNQGDLLKDLEAQEMWVTVVLAKDASES